MFDATIEMIDGVMIVSPKEVKQDVSQFKDGDIITCGWRSENTSYSWTCILRGCIEYISDNMFIADYCCLNSDGTYSCKKGDSDSATYVRYATEEEKKRLFDKLAEEGYSWDAEHKKLVELKWKPAMWEDYYTPSHNNFEFKPYLYGWNRDKTDLKLYEMGWVFKTELECQAFCVRLNEAISQVKP